MSERKILKGPVHSLVWAGEELVDWVGGGNRYSLDGRVRKPQVYYAGRFDAACSAGNFAAIYERLGTKGVILKDGAIHREINRSFYHANAYEYPICLWAEASGRVLMAHCPDNYNAIEIEDVLTGERLTAAPERKRDSFFHSRLQVNPDGTRLLSAGWLWHPWDAVAVYDIAEALRDPSHLDATPGCNPRHVEGVPESSACWLSESQLLIAGGERDFEPDGGEIPGHRLTENGIMIYDAVTCEAVHSVQLEHPVGTMMPVGETSVVTFYGYPRLISLTDGRVIQEWPDLPSGSQTSSIIWNSKSPPPPIALDPANRRFAVAAGEDIHVIDLK